MLSCLSRCGLLGDSNNRPFEAKISVDRFDPFRELEGLEGEPSQQPELQMAFRLEG